MSAALVPGTVQARPKVEAPRGGARLVERPRLIRMLRAGAPRRLSLLRAPAGFGKTALAVQWQRVLVSEGVPVAWVNLDGTDRDPAVFLGGLLDAVRVAAPELAPPPRAGDSPEERRHVLAAWANQLIEAGRELVLVLDGWDVVDGTEAERVLDFLVRFAPNLHLVVTARTCSVPVGRLQVEGALTEIGADALRFRAEETAELLRGVLGAGVPGEAEVRTLHRRTGGWIAALALAAAPLRGNPAAVVDLSGVRRALDDYLDENVLCGLPDHLVEFLATTSVCDRINGELAAAVSGRPDGAALLAEVERRELFLRPLDSRGDWFHYERVFADHLGQRLRRGLPGRAEACHEAAADWYARHGLVAEAVRHALSAHRDDRAAELLDEQALRLVEDGGAGTLLRLAERVRPRPLPRLELALAWANLLLQRPAPARLAVRSARACAGTEAGSDAAAAVAAEADVVEACLDAQEDRLEGLAGRLARCLATPERHRPWVVAFAGAVRAYGAVRSGGPPAEREGTVPVASIRAPAEAVAEAYGRCVDGYAATLRLDLAAARRAYRDARRIALDHGGPRSAPARLAAAMLGSLSYEHGELDTAAALLEEAAGRGGVSGPVEFLIATSVTLAKVRAARGDLAGAWQALDDGAATAHRGGLNRLSAAVVDERIRLHLRLADHAGARRVAEDSSYSFGDPVTPDDTLALARLLRAIGNVEDAEQVLAFSLAEFAGVGHRHAEALVRVELAHLRWAAEQPREALDVLVPAVALGARAGLRRSFVDGGPVLRRMIGELAEDRRLRRWPERYPPVPLEYLVGLVEACRADAEVFGGSREPARGPVPGEPALTTREIHILRLLDSGLSNKEIARQTAVSTNTVKWYLKGIFAKLGVTRRQESVSEARRRGILRS